MKGNRDHIANNLIITIDGPSGAGKSTVARMLARLLHYAYIDTGAMYRGVAYAFMKKKPTFTSEDSPVGDEENFEAFLEGLDLRFEFGEETTVYLDGEDISKAIREPEVSMMASKLSQHGLVRRYLYGLQRAGGRTGGIVLEGRDTGSVVFPDAHVKFYLDANPDERARRRHLELQSRGAEIDISSVRDDMEKRDKNDTERDLAPLVVPEGALYVDTSGLQVEDVVKVLCEHIAAGGIR